MLDRIRVVLVETTHPANIGSAARAMKTMGLTDLVLVRPKEFPSARATWLASGANDLLENATIVDNFEDAIADCNWVVGTSARMRRLPWPLLQVRDAAEWVMQRLMSNSPEFKSKTNNLKLPTDSKKSSNEPGRIAVLFGQEARGLTNEQLRSCQLHLCIPGNEEYAVLNIASAVQVVAYELRMAWLGYQSDFLTADNVENQNVDSLQAKENINHTANRKCPTTSAFLEEAETILAADGGFERTSSELRRMPVYWVDWDEPLSTYVERENFYQHFVRVLARLGFVDPANPRQVMTRVHRFFQRACPDRVELNVMRGILTELELWLEAVPDRGSLRTKTKESNSVPDKTKNS
ncbi:MAG: RNA methyltransferase [Pseudomonadota bacterium]